MNLDSFRDFVNQRYKRNLTTYHELYAWSIDELEEFWDSIWEFCQVIGKKGHEVLDPGKEMMDAKFFPQAKLNFAQNLLKKTGSEIAIYSYIEGVEYKTITWDQLHNQVARLQKFFLNEGLQSGDVIVGYMANVSEAVIAMLAAVSIGCIWSVCSPDFGVAGCLDRFSQINPKIFIANTEYNYNGKNYDISDKVSEIQAGLKSLRKTITVGKTKIQGSIAWEDIEDNAHDIVFPELDFNHPLCIVYSSGTTGLPKAIIHRSGGILLQHLKEHQLHANIKPGDRVFYYTTCGWMMWNWLVSALASQATIVLYDGSPFQPNGNVLWDLVDKLGISFLGVSAKYLDTLHAHKIAPINTHHLNSLEIIGSTGSPLMPERFEYVYQNIKETVNISSLSGGTDILSCFALGCPVIPVYNGELQTAGLGMAVDIFNPDGQSVNLEKGELVCIKPFPCQPLGFCNDEDKKKYRKAYFSKFPGVWHHGDFVMRTKHNGFIFYGRSDTVLKRGGIRIGTAEIYRQVEKIPQIQESVVVSQNHHEDLRIILCVQLADNEQLSPGLQEQIKQTIRKNTTPRHVPDFILQVTGVPKTKNGKLAELAAHHAINNLPIDNRNSLANPEILEEYQRIGSEIVRA